MIDRSRLRLLLIADLGLHAGDELRARVRDAVAGGVTLVQVRGKTASARELFDAALALGADLAGSGVPLTVNDRPDVALAAGAAGVHLGPEDLPPGVARKLHPRGILGLSARTPDRIALAEQTDADYLGTGALRGTESKTDTRVVGPLGIAAVIRATRLPVVAIGGVRPEDLPALHHDGAAGVAVIGGILGAKDPGAAAAAYTAAWPD